MIKNNDLREIKLLTPYFCPERRTVNIYSVDENDVLIVNVYNACSMIPNQHNVSRYMTQAEFNKRRKHVKAKHYSNNGELLITTPIVDFELNDSVYSIPLSKSFIELVDKLEFRCKLSFEEIFKPENLFDSKSSYTSEKVTLIDIFRINDGFRVKSKNFDLLKYFDLSSDIYEFLKIPAYLNTVPIRVYYKNRKGDYFMVFETYKNELYSNEELKVKKSDDTYLQIEFNKKSEYQRFNLDLPEFPTGNKTIVEMFNKYFESKI